MKNWMMPEPAPEPAPAMKISAPAPAPGSDFLKFQLRLRLQLRLRSRSGAGSGAGARSPCNTGYYPTVYSHSPYYSINISSVFRKFIIKANSFKSLQAKGNEFVLQ